MSLTNKVLLGLILGAIFGVILNVVDNPWMNANVVEGLMYAGGKLFVNALKMLVVPLVLFSLIPGVFAIGDVRLLGKVGTKSVVLYIATTAIAIATAIFLAAILGIGEGGTPPSDIIFDGKTADKSTLDILIGIVPTNIFKALVSGDMLSIIFFSIFFLFYCLQRPRIADVRPFGSIASYALLNKAPTVAAKKAVTCRSNIA